MPNDPTHMMILCADMNGQNERQLRTSIRCGSKLSSVCRAYPLKGADGWTSTDSDEADRLASRPRHILDGPQRSRWVCAAMYGFDFFMNSRSYAARGWAVFFTNPRGSTDNGEKFDRGVQLQWGRKATSTS